MLQVFKELIDAFAEPAEESAEAGARALQLATAVLLVEVKRADPTALAAERDAVVATLRQRFAFDEEEAVRLFELAESTGRAASDYYQFTSRINESLSHPQKIGIIENMWQIAYSDAHLDANENQLISKIAGLLYVTQGEYIGAKMQAKEAAGLV